MAEEVLGQVEEARAEKPGLRADAATAILLLALLVRAGEVRERGGHHF
jgi:hypothetical protein